MTATESMNGDELGFEAALARLETSVRELESGSLGLDDSLAKYELGVKLLAHCHGLLKRAERKVELLVSLDDDGKAETVAFDASATVERAAASIAPLPPKPIPLLQPPPGIELNDDELPF